MSMYGQMKKAGNIPEVRKFARGDIVYVSIPHATGHEMMKDRPGVVVSCNELNSSLPLVTVVMCSSSAQKAMLEHISIRSAPERCMALCEHIYTVDKSRVGRVIGHCTESELAAVDAGILAGL